MTLHPIRVSIAVFFLALISISGCSPATGNKNDRSGAPTSTPTLGPRPTHTPTLTIQLPSPTPEKVIVNTGGPSSPILHLDDTLFQHSRGLFVTGQPVGWSSEEIEASVVFTQPDGPGLISLQLTQTGYELPKANFESFVDAREFNVFANYGSYREVERVFEPTERGRSARVLKSFDQGPTPMTVLSLYLQEGSVISSQDLWLETSMYALNQEFSEQLFDRLQVNTEAAFLLRPYEWIFQFIGTEELFVIDIPTQWRYELSSREHTVIETFYAPDENSLVQNLVYNDGNTISRREAGNIALNLLRTDYATDIVITDDKVQFDGSERLTWYSPGGDYQGISFLESRGTYFLLFTVMYENAYEDIYLPVLEYIVTTYDVP